MFLRVIRNVCVYFILFVLFLILTPGLPPYDVEFVDHPGPPEVAKFEGPLAPNDWLDHVELLSGRIVAPSIGYLKVRVCKSFGSRLERRNESAEIPPPLKLWSSSPFPDHI